MPSARPSQFYGGGQLRDADGTIIGLVFTDKMPESTKKQQPKKAGKSFNSLFAKLTIQQDGSEAPVDKFLFVGGADDYEFEGATITGEKALGRKSGWYLFTQSLVDSGFSEDNFPEDPEGLVADYSAIINARCRFNWQVNAEATKKYGKVKSAKTGKEYDREDLIVTAYYGQAEPAKKGAAKGAVKTAGKTTVATGKPNGKASTKEVDIAELASEMVTKIVAAAKGQSITKSKLSVKILTSMADADESVRSDVREWAFSDENLAAIEGLSYDQASQTVSVAAD